jgi:hypothetical protein
VTAGRIAPASSWSGSTRGRHRKLHGVLEEGLGVAIGLESRRGHKLGKGCPAAAAGARTPASWRLDLSNKRAWMLRWCRREAGVARIGVASSRSTEFTAAATMADGGACLCSREEKRGKLYRRLEAVGRSLRTKAAGSGYGQWHGQVRRGMGSGVRRPLGQWRRGGEAVRRPAVERGTRGTDLCLRPRHPYLATVTKTPRTDRRSEGDLSVRAPVGRVGVPRRRRARRRACGAGRPDLNSTGPV